MFQTVMLLLIIWIDSFVMAILLRCVTIVCDLSNVIQMEVASATGSSTDTVNSQDFQTFPNRQITFLATERSMPALLLRLLLQCDAM